VRHTSQDIAASLAPKLYENARSLIQSALLISPQPIEFFQAVIILCMWSTTVGQVPLSIDSWLLSGFALQHCQSSSLFSVVTNPSSAASEIDKSALNIWFLWNHICLVHLHYCVGTSRRSMLQDWHIARCRAIVGSDRATNYELRMVAEIHLYRTVYDLLASPIDISQSLSGLQTWMKEWQFVLGKSSTSFYFPANWSRTTKGTSPDDGVPFLASTPVRPVSEVKVRPIPRIDRIRNDLTRYSDY